MSVNIPQLLAAAETGDTGAMNRLAWAYGQGEGVPRDRAKNNYWARRSAELGDPEGLYNHGVNHVNGDMGRVDVNQANQLWHQAAEKGHPPAMANLAISYLHGNGLPRDPALALAWMRRCALSDEPRGMGMVGQFFQFGVGVPADLTEAMAWYLLGAERDPGAANGAAALSSQLSALQQAQARRRAEEIRTEVKSR
jgi:uncharacterized protein